jgi:molybdenum cofactor biosynthesis enzyme MoaA
MIFNHLLDIFAFNNKNMIKELENIGFYTLSDYRAANISDKSPMWRCEMILTNACNFKCPYCRGLREDIRKTMPISRAKMVLENWISQGLKNVRFSGGEPTLYKHLNELVKICKAGNVEHIAISTNGSNTFEVYEQLIKDGVNDFSISLDACCASYGEMMAGIPGMWDIVVENIKKISKLTYVTVGVVLTEETIDTVKDIVKFAHDLGVTDIRLISAAQYNRVLEMIKDIPEEILDSHPILKYRVQNAKMGSNVRGIQDSDTTHCHLVKDDSVVAGEYHFPCVIYMREGGNAIGKVSEHMREERVKWFETHNSHLDPICRKNCLDVCIDANNKMEYFSRLRNV